MAYQTGNTLKNLLYKYVDTLYDFKEKTYKGIKYSLESYGKKSLEIAVPPVEMSSMQANAFKEAKEYASQRGIDLIIRIVK